MNSYRIKVAPCVTQSLFGLSFLYSLTFIMDGVLEFCTVYSFFYWIWLSYITRKTTLHKDTNSYGKTTTIANIIISICSLFGLLLVLLLSISFLARMLLGYSNFYLFVMCGICLVFLASVVTHITIAMKNTSTIQQNLNKRQILLGLLIFPVGVWTIQGSLK